MRDLREYREFVKGLVKEINKSSDWKWSAKVLKNQIRLTNGYLKDFERDYFLIESVIWDDQDDESIALYDAASEELMDCRTEGHRITDDGSFENCIKILVREAVGNFNNCY